MRHCVCHASHVILCVSGYTTVSGTLIIMCVQCMEAMQWSLSIADIFGIGPSVLMIREVSIHTER